MTAVVRPDPAAAPRQWCHRGTRLVAGWWFPHDWLDERERRRRLLGVARGGAQLLEFDDGVLVRLAAPTRADTDHGIATALLLEEGSWFALPLRASERMSLALTGPSLVRAHGGRVIATPMAEARRIDPSQWIDVAAWTVVNPATLVDEPAAPPRAVPLPPPVDVRAVLGGAIPPVAAERDAIIAAMERARTPAPARPPGLLARWLGLGASAPPQRALTAPRVVMPSGSRSKGAGVGAWLRKLVLGSPLARLIGRRQAAYLARTMHMFERGEFDDALRHAVPMSIHPGAEPKPPALSLLRPRDVLRIENTRGSAATSVNLQSDDFRTMQEIYRNAAKALERAGRIEQAAFVYFELLQDAVAGCDLLERHGRHRQAAELAEGRELDPGLVIRLWFLAGEPARAIAVARHTGAFADAVLRLERTHPEHAKRLRLLWGDWLATSGHFAAAVEAVWSIAPSLCRVWIEHALAWGGPVAARLLPRLFELPNDAQALALASPRALELIDASGEDAAELRITLAQAWHRIACPPGSPARALGRRLLRQMMLDPTVVGTKEAAAALRNRVADPLLTFELGGAAPAPTPAPRDAKPRTVQPDDRGLLSIADAVALERRRFLLALGDAGVRLVDADGRVLRHYELPATCLLLSDHGNQVITRMPRGEVTELGRIDLTTGKATRWCRTSTTTFAEAHDGAHWYVGEPGAVSCVDVHAEELTALWRVGRLPGRMLAMARSSDQLAFVLAHDDDGLAEVWCYALERGHRHLRARVGIELDGARVVNASVSAGGSVVLALEDGLLTQNRNGYPCRGATDVNAFVAGDTQAVACTTTDDGCRIGPLRYGAVTADGVWLELGGVSTARMHRQGRTTVVCDALGRVAVLDDTGRLVHLLVI